MVFVIFQVNWATAQNCDFSNPIPPNLGYCSSAGGKVRTVFLGSYCNVVSGGRISGDAFNLTVEDMTIYFSGDLVIDQNISFRRCTLLFDNGKGIDYRSHHIRINGVPLSSSFTFNNCYLGSCGGSKWSGISGSGSAPIINNNTIIKNATSGFSSISVNNFTVESTTFINNDVGVYIYGVNSFNNNVPATSLSNCIFENNNVGILASNYNRRFQLTSSNTFNNCEVGIFVDKVGGTTIRNQNMNDCGTGIKVSNPKITTSDGNNFVSNNIIGSGIGISVEDVYIPVISFIQSNFISGTSTGRSVGVRFLNSDLGSSINFGNVNVINNLGTAIQINDISFTNLNLSATRIYGTKSALNFFSNNISGKFQIIGNSWSFNQGANIHGIPMTGTISGFRSINSPLSFTDVTNVTFEKSKFDWYNSPSGSNGIVKISNSSGSVFKCDTFNGSGNNVYLLGTNTNTKIGTSIFNEGKMNFDNTMIGKNDHAGNRWRGSTGAKLIGSAPEENLFIVNYAESNAADGEIKPHAFEPSGIGPFWFPDTEGESMGCASTGGDDDGGGDDGRFLPDTTLMPGTCYPIALDIDGDGVCDPSDPDPHDPCVPYGIDQDGDGVCDGLDPDPLNPCVPLSIDTDNDGVCDTADPDPSDPCVPYGVDSDLDGICDTMDPDPVNPDPINPISHTDCWWLEDIHGDRLWAIGYKDRRFTYSIQDLEWIAQHFTGNETGGYASLHYVEAMTFLYEVLHTSPYYRLVSTILDTKYRELCQSYSSIPRFVKISHDIRALGRMSNQRNFEWTKKQILYNTLDYLSLKLNSNNPVDSAHLEYLISQQAIVRNQMATILETHFTDRDLKISQISSEISTLPEDFPVYNALKDYYIIYDQNKLRDYPLTNAQMITLTEMSKLCPLIFGEAVHHAKAMLVGAELNEFSDFDDSCLNTTWYAKRVDNKATNEILISPNPTNDWFRITSPKKVVKYDIVNTQGVLLKSKEHIGNEAQINIIDLPASMYYIIVYTEGGTSVTQKIIKM